MWCPVLFLTDMVAGVVRVIGEIWRTCGQCSQSLKGACLQFEGALAPQRYHLLVSFWICTIQYCFTKPFTHPLNYNTDDTDFHTTHFSCVFINLG